MKRLFAFALAAAMLLSAFPFVASAASGSVDGTSPYLGLSYHYRDSYFAQSASTYDAALSAMSFHLACNGAAYNGEGGTDQMRYCRALLGQIGFVGFDTNEDFTQVAGTDTMGAAAAYRVMTVGGKTFTVLALVDRTMNYRAEWASNFTLGTSGDAAGFSAGADKVIRFANEYVAENGASFVGELKLWIVGYSRGAAVANLVAGRLTKAGKLGSFSVAKDNIFGYTYETPRGASTDELSIAEARTYTNIHNIVSANDLVTKVAPLDWGFLRYGTDESVIPETRTAENNALFERALSYLPEFLAAYDGEGNRVFASETFTAKKLTSNLSAYAKLLESGATIADVTVDSSKTLGEVWDDAITALATAIGSRRAYAIEVENTVRLVVSEYLGDNYQSEAWATAKVVLKREIEENKDALILAALSGKEITLTKMLTEIVNTVLAESGLSAEEYGTLPVQIVALVPIAVRAILADVAIDNGTDLLSLVENVDLLFNPHYPEQCGAWLMALDPNESGIESKDVRVTDVKVKVEKVTTTKKVLFVKTKVTTYNVTITPVAGDEVASVEYRTLLIGRLTAGTAFTKDLEPTYLYIRVTDKNGNVTNWEYRRGTVKQVD